MTLEVIELFPERAVTVATRMFPLYARTMPLVRALATEFTAVIAVVLRFLQEDTFSRSPA